MKKLVFLTIVALLITLAGCQDCPPCPKDMDVPVCYEELITYQKGDTLRFINAEEDTLIFACSGRKYVTNKHISTSLATEGCCPQFTAVDLSVPLNSADRSIRCVVEYNGAYFFKIELNNANGQGKFLIPSCNFENWTVDVVTIAEKKFNNVLTLGTSEPNDTVYLNSTNEYHSVIIGFKSNGVEWAKID